MELAVGLLEEAKSVDWQMYVVAGLLLVVCLVPFFQLLESMRHHRRAK